VILHRKGKGFGAEKGLPEGVKKRDVEKRKKEFDTKKAKEAWENNQ